MHHGHCVSASNCPNLPPWMIQRRHPSWSMNVNGFPKACCAVPSLTPGENPVQLVHHCRMVASSRNVASFQHFYFLHLLGLAVSCEAMPQPFCLRKSSKVKIDPG